MTKGPKPSPRVDLRAMNYPTVSVRRTGTGSWTVDVTRRNTLDERFPIQAAPAFRSHADADDTARVLRGALADAYLAGRADADAETDADAGRRRMDEPEMSEARPDSAHRTRTGATIWEADRMATKLGVHPVEVWPEWPYL